MMNRQELIPDRMDSSSKEGRNWTRMSQNNCWKQLGVGWLARCSELRYPVETDVVTDVTLTWELKRRVPDSGLGESCLVEMVQTNEVVVELEAQVDDEKNESWS